VEPSAEQLPCEDGCRELDAWTTADRPTAALRCCSLLLCARSSVLETSAVLEGEACAWGSHACLLPGVVVRHALARLDAAIGPKRGGDEREVTCSSSVHTASDSNARPVLTPHP